ncbi:hypothetical protein BDV19DRAFT_385358 [Aspergillus venezuelensis]
MPPSRSDCRIWSSLPTYPDPTHITSHLAESSPPRPSFDHSKARIMVQAAGEASISMYSMMANGLFLDPKADSSSMRLPIHLLPEVMKAFRAGMEGKAQAEREGCSITVQSYDWITADLFWRVSSWSREWERYKEVVLQYALVTASELDDVFVAELILSTPTPTNKQNTFNPYTKHPRSTSEADMLTLSFLSQPIYTATSHASITVLSLLLESLYNHPTCHHRDKIRIGNLLGLPRHDHKVEVLLYIHSLSILAESLRLTPITERDVAVTVLLLPRFNHFIGEVEACNIMDPVGVFIERAVGIWRSWPVDILYRLVSGYRVDDGPGCLWDAVERCVEGERRITWDEGGQEWVLDLEA